MNARRYTKESSMGEYYHVGNLFITKITKEQYEEILAASNNKERELRPGEFICYMMDASDDIKAKYAQIVRNSPSHVSKNINQIKSKIQSLNIELKDLEELETLINKEDNKTDIDCITEIS